MEHQSLTFTETFNYKALQFILDNQKYYKTQMRESCFKDGKYSPFELCRKYLEKAKQLKDKSGVLKVSYNQKSVVEDRFFAKGSLSMQCMPREIRWTIAHQYYWDIDMANAHPTILIYLCKQQSIDTPELAKYVKDRKGFIKSVGLDYDSGKQTIIAIINGGKTSNKKLKVFAKEMRLVRDYFAKLEPEIYKAIKKVKEENPKGSLISHIMSRMENEILQFVIERLRSKKIINKKNNAVLCFDGIMVLKKNIKGKTNELLVELEKDINGHWKGLNMKLKVKEMNPMPLSLPYDFEESSDSSDDEPNESSEEVKLLDDYLSDNDYYWYDFVNEVGRCNYSSYDDLVEAFTTNINRVMFRTFEGNNYVRKISRDEMFYIDSKLPFETFHYTHRKTDRKGRITSEKSEGVSLSYLLNKAGINQFIKCYDKLTFAPNSGNGGREFNTWTGFKSKLLSKDEVDVDKCKPIIDAIYDIWAGKDDSIYKYILSWFHHIFRYPNKKSKVVIVLNSPDKQVGKGIIINDFLIPFVFGRKLSMSVSGLDTITSRFNDIMMNKLFVNCDELASLQGNNFHSMFDILKNRITDPTIKIEIKGGRSFIYPDFSNFLCCTNNDFTIKLEEGD